MKPLESANGVPGTGHVSRRAFLSATGVLVVGFAAEGTRSRALASGARTIKIHGEYVPVRAEIVETDAFSAHADADDILSWLAGAPEPAVPPTTTVPTTTTTTATTEEAHA